MFEEEIPINPTQFPFRETFDFVEEAPPSHEVVEKFIGLKNTAEAAIHRKITAKKRSGVALTPEEEQFCQNYNAPATAISKNKVFIDGVEAGCGKTIAEKAKEALAAKQQLEAPLDSKADLAQKAAAAIAKLKNNTSDVASDIAAKAKLALSNKVQALKKELENIEFQIAEFQNHLNEAKKRRAEIFAALGEAKEDGCVSDIDFMD